jgi:hypothetical protein
MHNETYQTAKLFKQIGFGYDQVTNPDVIQASINNRYGKNYNFSFWKFSPKWSYSASSCPDTVYDEKLELIHTTSNSSDFSLLLQEYREGNPHGYKAYLAPTLSMAQNWLRTKCNIVVQVVIHKATGLYTHQIFLLNGHIVEELDRDEQPMGVTYEHALEAGLLEAAQYIKSNHLTHHDTRTN